MGRLLLGEESTIQQFSQNLLKGKKDCEVGVLLGQTSQGKDYLLDVVSTPGANSNAEEPVATGQSSEKLTAMDPRWFAEHARQVKRMLPGGVDVIGLYVFGLSDILQKQSGLLLQLAGALNGISDRSRRKQGGSESEEDAGIVVMHMDSKTSKYTCRTVEASSTKAALKPAELKWQKFASKSVKILCNCNVNLSVLLPPHISSEEEVGKILQEAVEWELQRFQSSLFARDSQLLSPTTVLAADNDVGAAVQLDVYCEDASPYCLGKSPPPHLSQMQSRGTLSIAGVVPCVAYLFNPKPTCAHAIHALEQDLCRSLHARLELLLRDLHEQSQYDAVSPLVPRKLWTVSRERRWAMPKRVWFEHPCGVCMCDYMFPDEDPEDCHRRCTELLSHNWHGDFWLSSNETFPPAIDADRDSELAHAPPSKADATGAAGASPENPSSAMAAPHPSSLQSLIDSAKAAHARHGYLFAVVVSALLAVVAAIGVALLGRPPPPRAA